MRAFARFLAVVVSIAFVLVTVVAVFLHSAGTRVAQAQFYKDALVNEHVYERFPALVGETVMQTVSKAADSAARSDPAAADGAFVADLTRQLTPSDWEILLGAVITPTYLRQQVESSLDQFFAFVHGDSSSLAATISLIDVKRRITGSEAEEAYVKMLQGKPPCTPSQFEDSAGLPTGCRPAPEQMPQALGNFRKVMAATAEQIPDEIDPFTDLRSLDGPEGAREELAVMRTKIREMEKWAKWGPAVSVALALLIALLAARSLRGLLLWWGIPSLLAGLICGALALPFVFIGSDMVNAMIVAQLPPDVPAQTLQTVFGLVTRLIKGVALPALVIAAYLVLGSIVAMVVAAIARPRPA